MKQIAKRIVIWILARQVRQLRERHEFKVVIVAGSIGKTSTKFAIASVLSEKFRVRYQKGNYNDHVTVPLVFFDANLPSLMNPIAWLRTFRNNARQIRGEYPVDVVVLELGTDGPGQMAQFAEFVTADIGVVTAIAPEHMEFFGTLDAVAAEELAISRFSGLLLVNADLCEPQYLSTVSAVTYGIRTDATYKIVESRIGANGYRFRAEKRSQAWIETEHQSIAEVQLYSLLAAASVADSLGMNANEVTAGIKHVQPVSGRLQILKGIQGTTIIDDTYNASPEAVKAALDALYDIEAPQRIALLGNMNELGDYSEAAHKEIGQYCNPEKLDLLVTLAGDANKFTAAEAEAKGCTVLRVDSPYDAAEKIKAALRPGAVILAKGSQNHVFAEEAVKQLLADPADTVKLVRQSPVFMAQKTAAFTRPA